MAGALSRFVRGCLFLLMAAGFCTPASASIPTPDPNLTPTPAPGLAATATPLPVTSLDSVLVYENILAKRSSDFESYLISFYTVLGTVLTVGAAVVGVSVTVYNRRDINTVKSEIAAEYRKKISEELERAQGELTLKYGLRINEEIARIENDLRKEVDQIGTRTRHQIDETVKSERESLQQRFEDLNTEAAERLFHDLVEYASVISHVSAILTREPATTPEKKAEQYQERSDVIARLQKLQDRVLRHRTFNVLLGRLLRKQGDLPAAIAALTKAIDSQDPAVLLNAEKVDYGALLYNRACYLNLLAKQNRLQGNPELAETHARQSWNDLKLWAKLAPGERHELEADNDLAGLTGVPPRINWNLLWFDPSVPPEDQPESNGNAS